MSLEHDWLKPREKQRQQKAQQQYQKLANEKKPKVPLVKNLFWAFVVGGLICTVGQAVTNFFVSTGMTAKEAAAPAAAVMVFLGSFLTGIGIYDSIGKYAGAGSIVPITGFANSIVAPAMEFKREGYVFGVGAKMFVIAGPVIVYGVATAFVTGIVYWLIR